MLCSAPCRWPVLMPSCHHPPLQAANILSCLLAPRRDGDGGHGGDASVFTVWQLLGRLHARQLKPLTACAAFFDLPHAGAPRQGLPPPAVEAMLEVRLRRGGVPLLGCSACTHACRRHTGPRLPSRGGCLDNSSLLSTPSPPLARHPCTASTTRQLAVDCCSNLLYNVSPSDNASHGRRPAYLFELLRRLAWACRPRRAAAAPATAHGGGGGASGQRGAWEGLRAAVAASPHVAKLLGLWASAQASDADGCSSERWDATPVRMLPRLVCLLLPASRALCALSGLHRPTPRTHPRPTGAAELCRLHCLLPRRAGLRPPGAVLPRGLPVWRVPCPGRRVRRPAPQPVCWAAAPAAAAGRDQR